MVKFLFPVLILQIELGRDFSLEFLSEFFLTRESVNVSALNKVFANVLKFDMLLVHRWPRLQVLHALEKWVINNLLYIDSILLFDLNHFLDQLLRLLGQDVLGVLLELEHVRPVTEFEDKVVAGTSERRETDVQLVEDAPESPDV